MKISRAWLQGYFEQELPSTNELCDALTFHAFEIDGVDRVGNDDVLDVKVTANRGHDCLSHRGIAKELSAILSIPLKRDPLREAVSPAPNTECVRVAIDTPLCNRYVAGHITGVKVAPSPQWLVDALASMGQKSINNIVDATNYVMFGLGQPLHAFDAAQLTQKDGTYAIAVRNAHEGESLLALDDKTYELNPLVMVIADAHKDVAIGVAGVKGGKPAGISESTKDIIIESANFDGASVRKTAQALKLRTDASQRFEQVISPEIAAYGMREAVALITELAGGVVGGFVDVYPSAIKPVPVSVSLSKINTVLGITLSGAEVADVFQRLDFPYKEEHDVFEVYPPFERLDLVIPEDLIEEVGRIIGYDHVPAIPLPPSIATPSINQNFYKSEAIRAWLMERGFSEVYTSVFAEKGERVVANKVDGVRPFLRTNLADGLAVALEKNIRNKDLLGVDQVKIFEIGTVWRDGQEKVEYDIAVEKKKKAPTQEEYKKELDAFVATLPQAPESYQTLALSKAERYQLFSKYPFIVRDIAMWVPTTTNPESVQSAITENAGDLLVRIALFDRFEKEERLSIAFRLIFQSFDRTLTDEEVNAIMQKVTTALTAQGFEIR